MSHELTIRRGSKSFFFASLLFDEKIRRDCWTLYSWCRHCDDQIDLGGGRPALEQLKANQSPDITLLMRRHEIPSAVPSDFLEGFRMDVEGHTYRSVQDVETYSYHVAGVVGVMMAYIMGVRKSEALQAAIDMGIAMQMTNIARDVKEDFANGRVYLPNDWLFSEGLTQANLMNNPEALFRVVCKLLKHADRFYASGYSGLKYLPFRSAWAVSVAAAVYSAIGKKMIKTGRDSTEKRTILSFREKLVPFLHGTLRAIAKKWGFS